jgi:hypothetical protein
MTGRKKAMVNAVTAVAGFQAYKPGGQASSLGNIASALTGGPMIAAMRKHIIDRARAKAAETGATGGAPPSGGKGGGKMMPNMGQSESAAPKKKSVTQEVSAGVKEKLKKPTPKSLKPKVPKIKTAKVSAPKFEKPKTVTRYK